jgi:dTDP-4-amino-4,6-dideoxygalactose transaminase
MVKIPIFYPHIPKKLHQRLGETLNTKWIGQGPLVDKFEEEIGNKFNLSHPLFVNSGTSALELAYTLLDLKAGDEVVSSVFTCTATNTPLIRRGVKIIWADIDPHSLVATNETVRKVITKNTKAIVGVSLGGIKCDLTGFNVPVIIDACQAIGHNNGDMIVYSFQAIKHFTTADGGLLNLNDEKLYKRAKLLRWFGIDREKKKRVGWQAYQDREMTFDIEEPGFKYQPTDIDATFGLAGLEEYDDILEYRRNLFNIYKNELDGYKGIEVVDGKDNLYWLCGLILHEIDRDRFAKRLLDKGIETNMVQVRNDVFKIFGGRQKLAGMDSIENKYIYIPLHTKMTFADANYVIKAVKNV